MIFSISIPLGRIILFLKVKTLPAIPITYVGEFIVGNPSKIRFRCLFVGIVRVGRKYQHIKGEHRQIRDMELNLLNPGAAEKWSIMPDSLLNSEAKNK